MIPETEHTRKLQQLVNDYYQPSRGCLPQLADIVTGRTIGKIRAISQEARMDLGETSQLLGSINLIIASSPTREDAVHTIAQTFRTTLGDDITRVNIENSRLQNAALIAQFAINRYWELRSQLPSKR